MRGRSRQMLTAIAALRVHYASSRCNCITAASADLAFYRRTLNVLRIVGDGADTQPHHAARSSRTSFASCRVSGSCGSETWEDTELPFCINRTLGGGMHPRGSKGAGDFAKITAR